MPKFKPGDIVEFIVNIDGVPKGTLTKVIKYYNSTTFYSEMLTKHPERGHSEGGGRKGFCWNIKEHQAKIYKQHPILSIEQRVLNKIKYLDKQFEDRQLSKNKQKDISWRTTTTYI